MRDLGKVAHCCRIYVMKMVKELEKENLGVNMSGVCCGTLLYVGDIVLNWVMSYRRWLEDRQIRGSPGLRQTRVGQWWWDKRTVVRSGEFAMKRWKKQVCGTISKSMEIYNMKEKAEELAGNLEWMAMVDGELEAAYNMGSTNKVQSVERYGNYKTSWVSILPAIKL